MSGDEHDQVPVIDLDELTDDQRDRDVTAWRAGPWSRPRGRAEERGPPAACRQTISARSFRVHTWLARYRAEGIAGLEDRLHRPASCPHHTADDVEAAVRDLRTKHPRWGRNGLRDELLRAGTVTRVPSRSSIYRILVRRGLLIAGIPRAAMSPAASGSRTLEPATEGDF